MRSHATPGFLIAAVPESIWRALYWVRTIPMLPGASEIPSGGVLIQLHHDDVTLGHLSDLADAVRLSTGEESRTLMVRPRAPLSAPFWWPSPCSCGVAVEFRGTSHQLTSQCDLDFMQERLTLAEDS